MTQGQYPPLHPNAGDFWMNDFHELHVWTGDFWTKIQSAAMEGSSIEADYIPQPVPVTSSNRNTTYCSEEEAAEKLSVFEQAVDIRGRLDIMEKGQKAIDETTVARDFNTQVLTLEAKIDRIQKEMVATGSMSVAKGAALAQLLKHYQEKLYELRVKHLSQYYATGL